MQDESLAVVRDRYLESTQKDQGTGNYAREAERVLSNWLAWCRKRDPPVTSTGDLDVGVLGKWAQFWSPEERQAFCRFVDRRAEQAVDERGLDAVAELRDRTLVYLLAYSGARSAEVLRDPNDARRDGLR